ncbi:hypothetical protein HIM_04554 [Hirsutella minnesotensis 3608]|uniref:Zn(2)-C6 fungal-type domain-containing protein n=1 Tax=Hirsutella minnesotensis 3608 TaxID=1043627 RepID=A0A0F7ZV70_9HYPO|nr:hypothetical protein HIM_04554 [Hirsutella minnesotensis 3608]
MTSLASSSSAVPEPLAAESGPGMEPLSCVSCRARKLKCDRTHPACARCLKAGCECVYPESRRKPAVRRKNVKELEARLAQVEEFLSQVNNSSTGSAQATNTGSDKDSANGSHGEVASDGAKDGRGSSRKSSDEPLLRMGDFTFESGPPESEGDDAVPLAQSQSNNLFETPGFVGPGCNYNEPGQLMSLGYSETLPPFEVQEELNNYFFLAQYHFCPVIHSSRYYQAFYGGPVQKPPMCLQYAIWAMAATGPAKYHQYAPIFYQRARQYAEADEMRGHGEHFITIAHAQAWAILTSYEAKTMLFTRAAMSSAKCVRLVQMMGLDRLDGPREDLPPALGPPATWAELEERRRVFWGAFACDSHSSISTGWPCLIEPDDVRTRLPSTEAAFASGQEETAPFVDDVFTGATYGSFAGNIVVCHLFRYIFRHVHRPKATDRADDLLCGPYWERHRDLDNKLSSVFMYLPERLRLPDNLRDPTAVQTNLNLHAAVVTLHHAAIEMQDKHQLPESIKQTSMCRLKASAEEIVSIVKMSSHSPAAFKSPLCALALYCASTVYVYTAKSNPKTGLTSLESSNLEFLIHAMEVTGRHHEMTYAFLQQAYLDIERNGLDSSIRVPGLSKYRVMCSGAKSSIPLLARNSISKHTARSPVLPGRLPLDNPQGLIPPGQQKMAQAPSRPGHNIVRDLVKGDCFQPVLGAVTRNVAPKPSDRTPHKRRRVSASPGPESGSNVPGFDSVMGEIPWQQPSGTGMSEPIHGAGVRIPAGRGFAVRTGLSPVVLPDRTSSSASSPQVRDVGKDAQSSNSSASPFGGLGNTPEENRIDLRSLQERAGLRRPAEQGLFASSMMEALAPSEEEGAWALLADMMGWHDAGPVMGI